MKTLFIFIYTYMKTLFTGGSNKMGTESEDVLKNTVYIELYNIDIYD